MTQEKSTTGSLAAVGWLAMGTFAIGTEAFMIAPQLPRVADDLAVSIGTAGLLVTAFTLAYSLSSPVLTTLAGNINRRTLLISAMAAFAFANLIAWASKGYWDLMAARVLLAFSAGLYTPNAGAYAGMLVAPSLRGRALAIVNAGMTIAIVLGLPLGTVIGDRFGWRITFIVIAALATMATGGLIIGLKKGVVSSSSSFGLHERVATAKQPVILLALIQTMIWATGSYAMWTYIAPYLYAVVGLQGEQISGFVFTWGVAGALGLFAGGYLNDRFGSKAAIATSLLLLIFSFILMGACARLLSSSQALLPVAIAIFTWGFSTWGFAPAQVARLIALVGPTHSPVVLSLNASAMYLGFSAGSAIGGAILTRSSVVELVMLGAVLELAALSLLYVNVPSPMLVRSEPAE